MNRHLSSKLLAFAKPPQWSATALGVSAALLISACGGGSGADSVAEPGTGLKAQDRSSKFAPASAEAPANSTVTGEIIVQINAGTDINVLAAAHQLQVIDQFGSRPIWRLRVAASISVEEKINALLANTGVRFAEPNFESETPESRRRTVWAYGGTSGTFATQWAPSALRLTEAHAISTGAGIRVAVLDTGIDLAHPAFDGRLARTASGAVLGRDFVDDDSNPSEMGTSVNLGFGHGTHVAGLVSLVAPAAKLMPVRVLDSEGRGNLWVLSEALLWAANPDGNAASDDGAHVINLSLGTTQPTRLLRTSIALANCDFNDDDDEFNHPGFDSDKDRCANKFGSVVLAAAGNAGNAAEVQYPAAEATPGSLAVTASTPSNTLASFSNFGAWVQIAAPGENIISAFPGDGYATWSGTSMASPLAAGSAALVLATYADPRSVMPLDVAKRLTDRSKLLCGSFMRQIDAAAAVLDTQAPDAACT